MGIIMFASKSEIEGHKINIFSNGVVDVLQSEKKSFDGIFFKFLAQCVTPVRRIINISIRYSMLLISHVLNEKNIT